MRLLALLFVSLPVLFGPKLLAGDSISHAEELYQQTDYQASAAAVRRMADPGAAGDCLAGRDYFLLGDYKKASEFFQRAVALEPANAGYVLWLAKSFERRAETASPFTAPHEASKARGYFEEAVALAPNNQEALRALFDYYLEAPGFWGGGYDKAEAIARRIAERDSGEGRLVEAELADRRKQFDTAEDQLRHAIQIAPHEVDRVLDLARYLAEHGRIQESESAFDKAQRLAPNLPRVWLARARVYVEQKRDLNRARALLTQYLQSSGADGGPARKQAQELLKEASGA